MEKLGSQQEATILGIILLEIQVKPSVPKEFTTEIVILEPTWMTLIQDYVQMGNLHQNKKKGKKSGGGTQIIRLVTLRLKHFQVGSLLYP